MGLVFWGFVAALALLFYFMRRSSRAKADFWPSRKFVTFDTDKLLGNFFYNLYNPKSVREVDDILYQKIKFEMKEPYVGLQLFGFPQVIVCDLELAKKVFVKDADHFLGRMAIESMKDTDPLFANMLFFMEGEPWKELRAKMSPTFTTGKIKKMFHILDTSSKNLVDYLSADLTKKGQEVELLDTYGRYTMDVIASAAFGIDAKTFEEEDPIFVRMGKRLQFEIDFKAMMTFLMMMTMPKIAKWLGISMVDKEMEVFFTKVIKNAVKHRETTGDRRDDFLQLMLDARSGKLKDDEGEVDPAILAASTKVSSAAILSDEVLVAQSILFILAGFDTTQTLLVFAAYELALNPEVQETLHEELVKSWKNNDGKFTYETVNQLEYLDQIVNEALRMYPPVTRLERRTMHDYQIPDTDNIIPKGAQVVVQTFSIHRDPEYFPNPEKFDPERFSQENKNTRNPYAFQPFGHGPRNCIGMRFALTNAKMAIATLVHNFKFEPSAKTLIPMQFEKTNLLKPKGGMHLKVTKRNLS